MRLRVHRRHESGASNADYQNRNERVHKLNADDLISKRKMNNSFHTNSNTLHQARDQLQQTRNVNEQLYQVLTKSKPLYEENNKQIKQRTAISLPRNSQLEETEKGKRAYVGDSLVHFDNPNAKQALKINKLDKSNMLSSMIYGSKSKEINDEDLTKVEIFQIGSPLSNQQIKQIINEIQRSTLNKLFQLGQGIELKQLNKNIIFNIKQDSIFQKLKNLVKLYPIILQKKIIFKQIKNKILKEVKHEDNKQSKVETQIVEIRENKVTEEGLFNAQKINEIKHAIQRKYHQRTNFKSIFQAWDEDGKGSISSQNVSNMLNRMGIKCNLEEAKILVSTADKDNSKDLNLQEFLDLLFVNNIPHSNLQRNHRSYSTNDQLKQKLNEPLQNQNKDISSTDLQRNYQQQMQIFDENRNKKNLDIVLKNKMTQLLNNFWINDYKLTGQISQKELHEIIRRKVDLSSSIVSDKQIKDLFQQYQSSQNEKQFDYKSFIKDLKGINITEKEKEQSEVVNERLKQTKQFQNQLKKFKTENPRDFNIKDHDNPSHIDWMKSRADKLSRHIQKFFSSQEEFSLYLKQQLKQEQPKEQIHKNELLKTFKNMFDQTELKFEKRDYEGIMEMFQYNKHGYTKLDDIPQIIYQEDAKQMYERISQRIRVFSKQILVIIKGPPPPVYQSLKNGITNREENSNFMNTNSASVMIESREKQELKKQSETACVLQQTQSKQIPQNNSRGKRGQSLDSCQSVQYDGFDQDSQYSNGQIKNVLQKVENRLFLGDTKAYEVFKQFDLDKDGYVNKDELNQKLSQLSILNPQEQKIFNSYIDPKNQGYFNFSQFNEKIYSNMSNQFEQNEYDINPYKQKQLVDNRINMSKTYTNFINQTRKHFLPRNNISQVGNYIPNSSENNIIKPQSSSGMYASEQDRFSQNKLDFQQIDKSKKDYYHQNKIQNIRTTQNIIEQRKQLSEMLLDQKNQSNNLQRAAMKQVYENVAKNNILAAI